MSEKTKVSVKYFFAVYGFAAEFMNGVAFRRGKHYDTRNKKILKCPHCGKEFKSVDSTTKVELYRHSRKVSIKYHTSIPCGNCHNEIGIIYQSA